MFDKNSKKILSIILLVGLFVPLHGTHASLWGDFAFSVVNKFFAYSLSIMFTIVGQLLAMMVIMLAWVVNLRIYTNVPFISESWKIMRDFANMFFILALIVMAYGTIFNKKGYDFRSLIGQFLIVALLINFSMALCGLIIDGTQILNNTFLAAMGDIAGRLGDGLNPAQILPANTTINSSEAIANALTSSIIALLFSIFLIFTFAVSVAVPLAVAFARIPILWALIIVSPLAWLLSILPSTKKVYSNWWRYFLAWNLFLPYYLFFMYFALYFLSKKDQVLQALGQDFVYSNLTGLQSNFTFGLLFYYIMIAIFLIGGTKVAMSASMFSSTGITSVAKWGKGVAARNLGVTAAQRGALQKVGEIQKEGLPGRWGTLYGGEYALDQQTGRFAKRFGVRGAEIANQKAFVERAGRDYQDFERKYQNGQISEEEVVRMAGKFNAADPRGYAYRKLAAKIGQLDTPLFSETLKQLTNNPLAAEDFAKTAAGAKFSKMEGADLAKMAAAEGDYSFLENNVAARREMFKYVMTDKKAMSKLSDEQIRAGIRSFGGHTTADSKAFMKEIGKINPDYIVRYNLDSDISNDPKLRKDSEEGFDKLYATEIQRTTGLTIDDYKRNRPTDYEFQLKSHSYGSYLKSGDIKDTASIKVDTWRVDTFQEAMKTYISQLSSTGGRGGARRSYINRLERELVNTPGGSEKIRILFTEILDPTAYAGGVTPASGMPSNAPRGPLT